MIYDDPSLTPQALGEETDAPPAEFVGHDRGHLLRLVSGGDPFIFLSLNNNDEVLVDISGLDQEEAVAVLSEIAYALHD